LKFSPPNCNKILIKNKTFLIRTWSNRLQHGPIDGQIN
jgi:hypothetical protein